MFAVVMLLVVAGIVIGSFACMKIPPFFHPLIRISRVSFSILVIIVIPSAAITLLFIRRFGFPPLQAAILGSTSSIAVSSLSAYWGASLFDFGSVAISASILCAALVIWIVARTGNISSLPEEPLFSGLWQRIIFASIGVVFILAVWYPFFSMGTINTVEENSTPAFYDRFHFLLASPDGAGVTIPSMGDWSFIICSDVAAVVDSGVPPKNPFFCSQPLRYYYLYHLYTAIFVKLSGGALTVQTAGIATSLITAIAVFFCFFLIARKWIGSFSGAIFSLLLITLIGGFDIIPTIIYRYSFGYWPCNVDHWDQFLYWKIFTSIMHFHWFPQHLCGMLFSLLFFFILTRFELKGVSPLLCIVYLAASMGFSAFSALAGCAALFVYILLNAASFIKGKVPLREWRRFIRNVYLLAAIGIAAFALVGPMYSTAMHGTLATGSIIRRFRLPPLNTPRFIPQDYHAGNPISYLGGLVLLELAELGPLLIFGVAGLFCLRAWKKQRPKRAVLSILIASAVVIHTTEMGGTNLGDVSSKVFGISYWWSLALLSGLFLRERHYLWNRFSSALRIREGTRTIIRIGAITVAVVAIVLGVITTLYEINCRGNRLTLSVDEYMAFVFIRSRLPVNARIQRGVSNPEILLPGWAWRLSPFYNRYTVQEYSVDPKLMQRMENKIHEAFRTRNALLARNILRRYEADYLYIGSFEKKLYPAEAIAKFKKSPQYFKLVWSRGPIDIYKIQ